MTSVRRWLERAVTKHDYFHQPHLAESDALDPSRSYYYDLRARSRYNGPFEGQLPITDYGNNRFVNPVHAAQYGIGHLQRYWDTNDSALLARASDVAEALIDLGSYERQGLVWRYPLVLQGQQDWLSAMAQGQVASFLLRVAAATADSAIFEAARASLEVFRYDIADGGVRTWLCGHLWFEEYAVMQPPYTLNGFIIALLGLRDAGILLEDAALIAHYEHGIDTLIAVLPLFDFNGWSRYDLSQRTVAGISLRNLSSPFYHRFHVELLHVMAATTHAATFWRFLQGWQQGIEYGLLFYRALAEKVLYRLMTPSPVTPGKASRTPGTPT